MRKEYLDGYHAQVLFYPDYADLQTLLDSLATRPVIVVASTPKPAGVGPARFVHETTEDDKFTGRVEVLARLDRWAAYPAVRLITITAVGGLGKTALVAIGCATTLSRKPDSSGAFIASASRRNSSKR